MLPPPPGDVLLDAPSWVILLTDDEIFTLPTSSPLLYVPSEYTPFSSLSLLYSPPTDTLYVESSFISADDTIIDAYS